MFKGQVLKVHELARATLETAPRGTAALSLAPVADHLRDKRVAMVSFSAFPDDPRPLRTASAMIAHGMTVDVLCIPSERAITRREVVDGVRVLRIPIRQRRGGPLQYVFQYSAFILACSVILAWRTLLRRYDLVYVNNMPDFLVISALVPRILGSKVVLDLHDPMPELMMTIFRVPRKSIYVRLLQALERWSMRAADQVLTVNQACARLFGSRSCRPEKVAVVMNSPSEVFPFQRASQLAPARLRGSRFLLMYHGTLVERNGLDLAIDALGLVRKVLPSAELDVYGASTPFFERVISSLKARGLQDAVHYHGPKRLEEIVAAIGKCDLGVVPNHRNAFTEINTPTRIFEYLALGKPVVAPRTSGVEECFPSGSLLFFEAGSAESLASQILFAAARPADLSEITRRGQEVYLSHTWAEERKKLVNVIAELVRPQPRWRKQ